ncbi:hypothetical protein SAMN04488020_110136 [Palleronia marisminoris]|uniref:DUF3299 domain-containing protein n=2 Tax=Palleronia marisminoris TaxID=315423 RepID=A0A1Y5TBF0_9RHOB|nr:hypothetical protein SAMN04488020_110136 [Palleronia marisminoris]SLN59814.1 hypothetical protein PAM7066_02942 [Palleronia marisminoris]
MSRRFHPMRALILTLVTLTSPALAAPQGWSLLETIEIREEIDGDEWRAVKTFPDAVHDRAMGFRITGYVVPIEAEAYITTFLLVKDPANCPFCGTATDAPVIEVHLSKPLPDMPEFAEITVEGDLEFVDDPHTLQAVIMRDARKVQAD